MTSAKNLCEIVQRDRKLAGLTQDHLAKKLNEVECRPIDPFTKKPKLASRTWLAKLEAGLLRRELSLSVRQWLAKTLNGNVSLYESLSNITDKEAYFFDNLDFFPLVKFLAKSNRDKITFDELYRLCEAYRYCLKIGVSLFNPIEVGEGKLSVKS